MQYSYDMTAEHCRRTTVSTANGTPTPENSAIEEYAYSAEPAGDGLVYAVTRSISYNRYGEAETDSLLAGSMTHTITEQRDTLGRSTGYIYAKNDIPQQQTTIGYGADGRVASAGFTHQGEHKEFTYTYLPGTHLLHTLTHPNGLTLTQSYDATRDLPTDMSYSRADALVVRRSYDYDLLGRPTARNLARYGTETQDTFGYNTRSELTAAHVNSADYSYAYDAIGNRTSATEAGTRTAYTSNRLNQYTAEGSFHPEFDADGNQTLIKTSTGTWNVTYNAKNRPIRFVKSDNSVIVECTYDTMGRRATKKVTTNGTLTEHRRFLYRGYLQIACCDLTRAYTPALWFITWDPTQPTATRPLAIQKNGTWYTYGWDLTKNICETYRTDARIDLAYTYTPYGEVSPAHTYDQPLRWSSEYHDVELGLVYYNYRHYNPAMGRWMGRDLFDESYFINTYRYVSNSPVILLDLFGLLLWEQKQPKTPAEKFAEHLHTVTSNDCECKPCNQTLPKVKELIISYNIFSYNKIGNSFPEYYIYCVGKQDKEIAPTVLYKNKDVLACTGSAPASYIKKRNEFPLPLFVKCSKEIDINNIIHELQHLIDYTGPHKGDNFTNAQGKDPLIGPIIREIRAYSLANISEPEGNTRDRIIAKKAWKSAITAAKVEENKYDLQGIEALSLEEIIRMTKIYKLSHYTYGSQNE